MKDKLAALIAEQLETKEGAKNIAEARSWVIRVILMPKLYQQKQRIKKLEEVLRLTRLTLLDIDTVNPDIANVYRQIVEVLRDN